jgi:hypothetical protein
MYERTPCVVVHLRTVPEPPRMKTMWWRFIPIPTECLVRPIQWGIVRTRLMFVHQIRLTQKADERGRRGWCEEWARSG